MSYYYIIMADIIDSSKMESDQLMVDFKTIVEETNSEFKSQILSPLTITLGDEFQGVVSDLKTAIEIIFHMDEALLKSVTAFKLRFIINYGKIETPINKENAYGMLGDGLTTARQLLSEIKPTPFQIRVVGVELRLGSMLNLALELYRSIYDDWTDKDREVVLLFIQFNDYRVVAERYKRDPSSMWRREKSLKIREFNSSRKLIRKLADDK